MLRNVPVENVPSIRHSTFTSRKQTHMLSPASGPGRAPTSASVDWNPIGLALGERTQVEPFGRRSGGMARDMSNRGGQLTPGQAREGHRWIRLTVLAAVLQVWMMATVVALLAPRLLALSLALGAAYSLAAPLLFRYLDRDIQRRVMTGVAADGFVHFARTPGLRSSSVLSPPPH